jgi:MFS family permease
MSTNFALVTAGMIVAGWLTDMIGARWMLAAAGAFAGVAGIVGFELARRAFAKPRTEAIAVSGPV